MSVIIGCVVLKHTDRKHAEPVRIVIVLMQRNHILPKDKSHTAQCVVWLLSLGILFIRLLLFFETGRVNNL